MFRSEATDTLTGSQQVEMKTEYSFTPLSARSLSKMAHIYKLRRDKLLELIEAENSWWLPPPSSLKPPTPSACVVKTVSGLFARNDASKQRGVGTDVKDVNTGEKTGVSCGRRGANEVLVWN